MNGKVDEFLKNAHKWQAEMMLLREIVLKLPLTEDFKWGKPCYTFERSNVVLIHAFKEYCALLFFKGALMTDAKGMLVRQTGNVQAARQLRFGSEEQIKRSSKVIQTYIREAIEVEKSGMKVEFKKTDEFIVPAELQTRFGESPEFRSAFERLTPGRQRAYLLYFGSAKQAKTRDIRIDRYMLKILAGKGLDD